MKNVKLLLAWSLTLALMFISVTALAAGGTLTLPKAVKIIEEEAFSGDISVQKVVLPNGVTEIQRRAFANSSLKEINLPNTLQTIGDEAFYNTSLRDVFLPSSLRYISPNAFSNIEDIHFFAELDCYAISWCEANGYPVNTDWKETPFLYATKSGEGVQLEWNVNELADNYIISERVNGKLSKIATVGSVTKYTISSVAGGAHSYVVQPTKNISGKTVTGNLSNYVDYQNLEDVEIEEIVPSISVNHPILGDIFSAGTFEMFNGKAHQTWTVTSNCAWTLTKSDTWFTVDTTSGSAGTTTVVLNMEDGAAAGETRTGAVTFKINGKTYKTVNFKQVGPEKALTITHPNLGDVIAASPIKMHNGAAHQTWTITSNAAWKLTKTGSWFTIDNNITSGNAGTTTIVLRMTDGADPGETRTGTLKFYFGSSLYATVKITQDGGADTDPAASISVVHPWIGDVIDAGSANLTNSTGQSSNWTVFANYDWTITTSGSWFTVSPTSGSANIKTNVKITTTSYAPTGYNTGSIIFKKGSTKKATIKLYQGEGYDPSDNEDSFTVNHPYLGNVLDQDTIYMHNGSSYQTWSVVSNVDWSLTKSGSWFTVSPTSGSAKSATDVKLTFTSGVAAGESREGYVRFTYYLNGKKKTSTVYIAQDGGPAEPTPKNSLAATHALLGDVFALDAIEMHNGVGAEQNWSITSNKSWKIVTTGNWFSVSRTTGSANTDSNPSTNLKITITDYARPGTRNDGTITFYVDGVNDKTVSIYQDGGKAASPSMTIGSSDFGDVLTYSALSLDNAKKSYDFTIKANRAWSIEKSGSWFSLSQSSGSAETVSTVKVTVNTLPAEGQEITGTLTFKVDGTTCKTLTLKIYAPKSGSDEYTFKYLSNTVWTSTEYKKSTYYQNLITLDQSLTGSAASASGLISVAKTQSGYHEGDTPEGTNYSALQGNTNGSNNFTEYMCSFNRKIITSGLSGQAWCAYFVTWCARRAGISTNLIPNFSGCTSAVNSTLPVNCNAVIYTKDLAGSWTPSKGDLIFFTGSSIGYSGHVGIVDSVSGQTVTYHDGNGGGTNKVRTNATINLWASSVYGYAHINYDGKQNGTAYEPHRVLALYNKYHCKGPDVKWVQNKLTNLGYYTDTVDGDFGTKTDLAVKAFQKENGLTADGIVGPATLNALKNSSSNPKPSTDPTTSITKNTMIANLNASNYLGGKKNACVQLAGFLWDSGFPPAYIAGVLGNIMHEGSQGHFENIMGYTQARLLQKYPELTKISDGGKTHQNYIAHMKGFTDYDGCGHSHTDYSTYSNKNIYDSGMSLKAVDALLTKYQNEGWNARFGLGVLQWTAGRTVNLMNFYHAEAKTSDTITSAQCLTAEMKFCNDELLRGWYGTFTSWNSNYASKSNAAYIAGVMLTQQYIKPGGTHYSPVGSKMLSEYSIDITRGNSAQEIYKIMIGQ